MDKECPCFWPGLETAPGYAAVALTWTCRLGPEHARVRSAFLQRQPGLARFYPCPEGCNCEHEVLPAGSGHWCAVCRCDSWNCPDLRLTGVDLELWEVSLSKLARAICRAFGLRQQFCDLGIPGIVQAGAWSADAFPVFLAVQGSRDQFRNSVVQLCARLRRRFILFAPTRSRLDAVGQEMLDREQSVFFALEEVVRLSPAGTLVPLKAAGELFAAFRPSATDAFSEDAARGAFELVKRLDVSEQLRAPTLVTVFRLYCIEQLSAARIARLSGCAKSTVLERLKLLRQKTGVDPARFRQVSLHLAQVEDALSDPRAKQIHRRTAALGDEEEDRQ